MSSEDPGIRKPIEEQFRRPSQLIPWTAVLGVVVAGVVGLVGGIGALSRAMGPPNVQDGSFYLGAGACLGASALAFGLLTNAIFRR